jgi:uncharacterized protein with HEPN domain
LRDYYLYLFDIKKLIEKIQKYTQRINFRQFVKNDEKIDAVIRNFEIIGEAAKHIPKKIQQKYSHLPWSEMVSMRNVIVHGYFGLDLNIIWKTIKEDLLSIKGEVEKLIKEEEKRKR